MQVSVLEKCIYYFFKGLGLAPINYSKRKLFYPSIPNIIYNTILITSILAMSYVAIKLSLSGRPSIVFDTAIDVGYKSISGSTGLIILFTFIHRQNDIVNIANKLKALYDLSHESYDNTASKFLKNTYILIMLSWLPLLLSLPIEHFINYGIAVYYIVTYICEAIVKGTIFQYIIALSISKQLFETVNDHLNDVTLLKKLANDQFLRLFKQHSAIVEICEELNDFYSLPILSSLLHIFVTLILTSYYIIKPLIFYKDELTLNLLLHCVASLTHEIASLYLFTKTTSGVIKESKRVGKIIVDKWLENADDKKMCKKLHQFSTCLLHQNVQFSAAGLLVLDGTLLMSVIGSITTYMVILLQFQHQNSTQ